MVNKNFINLSWPLISSCEQVYSQKFVSLQISKLSGYLVSLNISNLDNIVLIAESNLCGILFSYAAINLGLKINFVSYLEPAEKIKKILEQVNYKFCFTTSIGVYENLNKCEKILFVNNLKLKNNHEEYGVNLDKILKFKSLLRTSGTSSKPKIVQISGAAHLESAYAVCKFFNLDKSCCWGLSLPLFHVSGLSVLFRALISSMSLCFFNKHDQEQVFSRKLISHVSLVPTQLARLLNKKMELSYLKAVILGGDKVNLNIKSLALKKNIALYQTYGLTESGSMVYIEKLFGEIKSQILSHAKIKINNKNQILIKSKSLFDGYVCEKRLERRDPKIYFATGDLGFFDNRGFLRITGRMSNRIIRGGENIQAEEVEQEIAKFPGVKACVVLGIPDRNLGESLHAVIAWEKSVLSVQKLVLFLQNKLSYFKIPQEYHEWPYGLEIKLKISRGYIRKYVESIIDSK